MTDRDMQARAFEFGALARRYCRLLETLDELDAEQRSVEITRSLARLLDLAEALPRDASPSDDADPPAHPRPRFDHGTVDYYYEVFDPFTRDGLVVGSLTDDLSDIYADLQKGLALLDRGEPEGAVWSWRFNFDAHWGDHLVDALRMLRRVNAGYARDISREDPGR